ncbi:MAG: poly-gamma-glutamate synthase PgsB, partial [Myxococcales bacterium]|nr:poly-gamma-glutamate synthase PgsB [Myxococcales bacterium]
IHVNGTRGKSSVTRLIAGALRAHGLKVYAKTTGTLPRMIMADGTEYPVYRPARANIIEQVRIVALAARQGAEALVIECMALQPRLQSLAELRLVRATHGVITNARPDHLDVMGPGERDVALALLGTTPVGATLFTAERDFPEEFRMACADRGSDLVIVAPEEIDALGDEEMARFRYVEHKENVALVLKVTDALGIDRETAMRGMIEAPPDTGALGEFDLEFFGRRIMFVNGFAANDPESSERIWNIANDRHPWAERRIMVLNCRADRPDRSRQLGEVLATWRPADRYLLVGTGTYALARTAVSRGLSPTLITPLEGAEPVRVFEEILGACGRSAMVMGLGNIGGIGLELLKYFSNRAKIEPQPREATKGDSREGAPL